LTTLMVTLMSITSKARATSPAEDGLHYHHTMHGWCLILSHVLMKGGCRIPIPTNVARDTRSGNCTTLVNLFS
jgi:hypothetical protein